MSSLTKKIGRLSALVLMTGGTVGAGIFYKSQSILENSHGDFVFAIISWLVAALGIISIGLALVEISSVGKRDLGIISWVRNFTGKKIGRFSSSYMLVIYYPISMITLSLYGVQALEDAFLEATGTPMFSSGYFAALLAFGIICWLLFFSWLSFRTTEKSQIFFTIIKFFPIVIAPIFAFIWTGQQSGVNPIPPVTPDTDGLIGTFKGLGIIASIPAILFTFDGFFTVASIRSNLRKPKSLASIIMIGLLIITGIYLYISVSFSLPGNDGSILGIGSMPKELKVTLLSLIFIAVIGVVNGYTMATNRVYMIATNDREFYLLSWMYKKMKNTTKRDVSYIFLFSLTVLFFTVVTPFTLEVWKLSNGGYNHSLYTMSDILTNYTSLFVFIIIGIAIFGGLINRKTNRVATEKSKFFIPAAIVSTVFLMVGAGYFLLAPLIDLAFLKNHDDKMSRVLTFSIMIGTILLTLLNTFVELYFDSKKVGLAYFPENYISINVLYNSDSDVSIDDEEKKQAYLDYEEEGWTKIRRKFMAQQIKK